MGRLQLALVLIVAASVVVMAGLLSTEVRIAALVVLVAGTWLVEPERSRRGGGWWSLVAVGALISVAALTVSEISEPAETAAGIAAIAGAALTIVGATIGFPRR